MKPRGTFQSGARTLVWLGLLGGCAHPSSPPTAGGDAEAARREERRKILQEYWYEHTLSPRRDPEPSYPTPVDYPAGTYSGINYGPRRASDPGMGEPPR